jgi:hypothetical protein
MKVARFAIRDTYACPTLTIPGTCGSRISRLSQRAKLSPPFIVLFFATGWIYYRVASRLFGSPSTLIALFTLNTTPFLRLRRKVESSPPLFRLAMVCVGSGRPAPSEAS